MSVQAVVVALLALAVFSTARADEGLTRQQVKEQLYETFLEGRLPQDEKETFPAPPSNRAEIAGVRKNEATRDKAYSDFAK